MKDKRHILAFCFSLMLISTGYSQHHPLFSQYMFNGIVINPAYSPGKDVLNAGIHYRKQWAGFTGAPSTFTGFINSSFKKERYGLGLTTSHETFGINRITDITSSFAYRIRTSHGLIGLGLGGGFSIAGINRNLIKTVDDGDIAFTDMPGMQVFPKIALGAYFHNKNLFAGISAPQWLIFNENNPKIPPVLSRTWYLNAGYKIPAGKDVILTPSFLARYIAGSPLQADLNTTAIWRDLLTLGASYRTSEAFIFLIQWKKDKFRFGYAYDILLGPLNKYSSGSHELMIRYELDYGVVSADPKLLK